MPWHPQHPVLQQSCFFKLSNKRGSPIKCLGRVFLTFVVKVMALSSRKTILTELTKKKIPIKYGEKFREGIGSSLELILGVSKESLSISLRTKFDTEVETFYHYVPTCMEKCGRNKPYMLRRFSDYFDNNFVLEETVDDHMEVCNYFFFLRKYCRFQIQIVIVKLLSVRLWSFYFGGKKLVRF